MSQNQLKKKRRAKSQAPGRFKLAVYFHVHRQPEGKPYYFRSNVSQDRGGTSLNRLKKLVTDKWKGSVSVNWAAVYENGTMVAEFSEKTNWQWALR